MLDINTIAVGWMSRTNRARWGRGISAGVLNIFWSHVPPSSVLLEKCISVRLRHTPVVLLTLLRCGSPLWRFGFRPLRITKTELQSVVVYHCCVCTSNKLNSVVNRACLINHCVRPMPQRWQFLTLPSSYGWYKQPNSISHSNFTCSAVFIIAFLLMLMCYVKFLPGQDESIIKTVVEFLRKQGVVFGIITWGRYASQHYVNWQHWTPSKH